MGSGDTAPFVGFDTTLSDERFATETIGSCVCSYLAVLEMLNELESRLTSVYHCNSDANVVFLAASGYSSGSASPSFA